jgi:hypothetical protein
MSNSAGLTDLAITDDSMIAVFASGRHGEWRGIPRCLDNKLRGRQPWLPRVRHVALGPGGQYFVLFADGNYQAVAPDDFLDAVRGVEDVARVALGPWGVWVVLYSDGTQAWSAGLPTGLYNQLNSRARRLPRPVSASIGPNGEWFVAFADGKWRAGGLWGVMSDALDECAAKGTVRHVLFGTARGYLIAYD